MQNSAPVGTHASHVMSPFKMSLKLQEVAVLKGSLSVFRRMRRRTQREAPAGTGKHVNGTGSGGCGESLCPPSSSSLPFLSPPPQLYAHCFCCTCIIMLRLRPILTSGTLHRRYATAAGPHALVLLEHRAGVIEAGSLSALAAAQQLGGQVTGLVVGAPDQVKGVVEKAKR